MVFSSNGLFSSLSGAINAEFMTSRALNLLLGSNENREKSRSIPPSMLIKMLHKRLIFRIKIRFFPVISIIISPTKLTTFDMDHVEGRAIWKFFCIDCLHNAILIKTGSLTISGPIPNPFPRRMKGHNLAISYEIF